MHGATRPRIAVLNKQLICELCKGYLIDATAIIECLHAFCKSCIVHYLETHKYCPICDVLVHKTKPLQNIRPDHILQKIVYKLVPNLYKQEINDRKTFYSRMHPQLKLENSEAKGGIINQSYFFTPDDTIHITLEYVNNLGNQMFLSSSGKRYFRCPAAVKIGNLQKLIYLKYCVTGDHDIIIFCNGIQLSDYLTLMDIAYIYSWKRTDAIPLMYQILKPHKQIITFEDDKVTPQKKQTEKAEKSSNTDNSYPCISSSLTPSSSDIINNNTIIGVNLLTSAKMEVNEPNNNLITIKGDGQNKVDPICNSTFTSINVLNYPPTNSNKNFSTVKDTSTVTNVFNNKCIPSASVTSSSSIIDTSTNKSSNNINSSSDNNSNVSNIYTSNNVNSSVYVRNSNDNVYKNVTLPLSMEITSNLKTSAFTQYSTSKGSTTVSSMDVSNRMICSAQKNEITKDKISNECDVTAKNESKHQIKCETILNVGSEQADNTDIPKTKLDSKCKIDRITRHDIECLLPVKKPKLEDDRVYENEQNKNTIDSNMKMSPGVSNQANQKSSCSNLTQNIDVKIKWDEEPVSYDINTVTQIYKEKMLKSSSKPWNPALTKLEPSKSPVPSADSGLHLQMEKKQTVKSRNIPRYLGNPSSGIKPMYPVSSTSIADLTVKDTCSNIAPTSNSNSNTSGNNSKKPFTMNVPLMKIDPKTLCPIIPSSSSVSSLIPLSSPSLFPSSSSSSQSPKKSLLYTPTSSKPTNQFSAFDLMNKTAHLNPYAGLNHNPNPLLSSINPLLYGIYPPSFPIGDRSMPNPSSLDFMKAMSSLYPTGAYHPSLPPSISMLLNPHHSFHKHSSSFDKRTLKSTTSVLKSPKPDSPSVHKTKKDALKESPVVKMNLCTNKNSSSDGAVKSKRENINGLKMGNDKKLLDMSSFSLNNILSLDKKLDIVIHRCNAPEVHKCDQVIHDSTKDKTVSLANEVTLETSVTPSLVVNNNVSKITNDTNNSLNFNRVNVNNLVKDVKDEKPVKHINIHNRNSETDTEHNIVDKNKTEGKKDSSSIAGENTNNSGRNIDNNKINSNNIDNRFIINNNNDDDKNKDKTNRNHCDNKNKTDCNANKKNNDNNNNKAENDSADEKNKVESKSADSSA